jgi:inhibitor of cysteine peptidase
MSTKLNILALSLCCFAFEPRCVPQDQRKDSEKAVIVTEKDDKGKVKITIGQFLVVKLEAQPGTGYGWEIAKNDSSKLRPIGKPTYEKKDDDLIGGPETQAFRFRGEVPGTVELELHYRRPFEKATVKPAKVFRVNVVIDKDSVHIH